MKKISSKKIIFDIIELLSYVAIYKFNYPSKILYILPKIGMFPVTR